MVEVPIAAEAKDKGAPDLDTTTDEEHDVEDDDGDGVTPRKATKEHEISINPLKNLSEK